MSEKDSGANPFGRTHVYLSIYTHTCVISKGLKAESFSLKYNPIYTHAHIYRLVSFKKDFRSASSREARVADVYGVSTFQMKDGEEKMKMTNS